MEDGVRNARGSRHVRALASSEHGSESDMVWAMQELVCWRAGAGAGATGT
jgi:hypothetical protein